MQLRGTSGANITGKGNSFLYSVIVTMCCRKRPGHTAPRNRLHTVPVTAPPLMEHHPVKPTITPRLTGLDVHRTAVNARLGSSHCQPPLTRSCGTREVSKCRVIPRASDICRILSALKLMNSSVSPSVEVERRHEQKVAPHQMEHEAIPPTTPCPTPSTPPMQPSLSVIMGFMNSSVCRAGPSAA